MPEIEVNVEVYCAKCGEGLCNQTEFVVTSYRREPSFRVSPCETCLENERCEGYNEGYNEGYSEGHSEGASEQDEI